jgi:hypothetical protein
LRHAIGCAFFGGQAERLLQSGDQGFVNERFVFVEKTVGPMLAPRDDDDVAA